MRAAKFWVVMGLVGVTCSATSLAFGEWSKVNSGFEGLLAFALLGNLFMVAESIRELATGK